MKCLIVLKNITEVSEEEGRLIEIVKKYCEVDITDPVHMMANQKAFIRTEYLAIITSGGDGTVLKTVSICTDKENPVKRAEYIDYKPGREQAVHIGRVEKDRLFIREDTLLPVVFAFDCGVKGRLCCIKKREYETGYKLLTALMEMTENRDIARINYFYRNETQRRVRFIVNSSVHVLNEIYVYSRGKGLLGGLDIYINSQQIYSNLRCDGVIISTSAGSSGYNASAGGPVFYGSIQGAVITAVAPSDRKVPPVVICLDTNDILIKNTVAGEDVYGVIDGCMKISSNEIIVKKSVKGAVYFVDPSDKKEHDDFMSAIKGQ